MASPVSATSKVQSNIDTNKNYNGILVVLASLFFIWALVTNINDILIPHLKKACDLTDFESSLVQFAFFGAYFVMSIPSGAILKKVGYKWGIIIGLSLMILGALIFIPAAMTRIYAIFLGGLFVLGSGITLLQVAANPYVSLLGKPETAPSRLNLTQAINSLGASVGPFLGGWLILSGIEYSSDQWAGLTEAQKLAYQITEASSVIVPYAALAGVLVLIALLIFFSDLPAIEDQDEDFVNHHLSNDKRTSVWQYRHLTMGVIAIFLYVGAEIAIGSFIIKFAKLPNIANMNELEAKNYISLYMFFAMTGRFLGAALLRKISPHLMLGFNAILAIVLLTFAITTNGIWALYALAFVGFSNSIMFPTIFTLGINELGRFTKTGSSYLIMGIVGGAVIVPLMGFVSDWKGDIQFAFIVPLLCYVFIIYYGFIGSKVKSH